MSAVARTFDPPLKVPLRGGYDLLIKWAGPDRSGGTVATIEAWNGTVLYNESKVRLTDPTARRKLQKKLVEREPKMDAGELETTLLNLSVQIPEELKPLGGGATPQRARSDSQATRLVTLVTLVTQGVQLFHEGDVAYAAIPVGDHLETHPLRAKGFRRWAGRLFYELERTTPGSQAVQDALAMLEGMALHDGPDVPVHIRLAEHDGAIYVDLANAAWQVVEVTAEGWRVVAEPPVKFRRARGMQALPPPMRGGTADELRRFVNVRDDDWPLLVAWLIAALRPRGPYPVLVLHAEQGSGKSTTERVLRALVDPNEAALRSQPKDEHDLVIAASNGWFVALDNLSRVEPWMSDAICRLATGGGFATRELYSDRDEVLFSAMRPVLLNGIEELATRGDLLSRAIVLDLPKISERVRRDEERFWREFEAARPRILGALLEAVSAALRNLADVHLEAMPRMADFARWAVAAEPALGWDEGLFLSRYFCNIEAATSLTLESSPVGRVLLLLRRTTQPGHWEGTPTELLDKVRRLAALAGADRSTRQALPAHPTALSNTLTRLAPALRAVGIEVSARRTKDARIVSLDWVGAGLSPASPPSLQSQNDPVLAGSPASPAASPGAPSASPGVTRRADSELEVTLMTLMTTPSHLLPQERKWRVTTIDDSILDFARTEKL